MRSLKIALALLSLTFSNLALAYPGVFPQSTFQNLDYGLYWFGNDDNYQKAQADYSNAYYNKNAPSIIFIHGWQSGSSQAKPRQAKPSQAKPKIVTPLIAVTTEVLTSI